MRDRLFKWIAQRLPKSVVMHTLIRATEVVPGYEVRCEECGEWWLDKGLKSHCERCMITLPGSPDIRPVDLNSISVMDLLHMWREQK